MGLVIGRFQGHYEHATIVDGVDYEFCVMVEKKPLFFTGGLNHFGIDVHYGGDCIDYIDTSVQGNYAEYSTQTDAQEFEHACIKWINEEAEDFLTNGGYI